MSVPVTYQIRDRGPTPRGMKKIINQEMKASWFETGVHFHATMSDNRFTHAHATEAGYGRRSRNYELKKLKTHGHTYPLEFTGETRRLVRTANITSTSKGGRVAYRGARKFNFRNPKSQINMVEEFSRVTRSEADELTRFYDADLDKRLNSYTGDNQ